MKLIGIDVLSQQDNFLVAFVSQVSQFVENGGEVTATFASSRVRDDAVGAEVVASAHDANIAGKGFTDARRDDVAVSFRFAKLNVDGVMALLNRPDEVGEVVVVVWTSDEVDTILVEEFVLESFRHAANHANEWFPVSLLGRLEFLDKREHFLLRIVTYGTGVEQHKVRFADVLCHLVAVSCEDGGDDFAVRLVHLASVCFDE